MIVSLLWEDDAQLTKLLRRPRLCLDFWPSLAYGLYTETNDLHLQTAAPTAGII